MRRILTLVALALLFLAAAPAALAGEVHNGTGKYDGLDQATVTNRTKNLVFEDIEIDLEGRFIEVRLPGGSHRMRIAEMWDRRFEMEITARDGDSGDLFIVRIKT